MTEILTESFCERCGTRYTFESARPRVRLKGVKVLSRGLKNFVMSDDTSIEEAMAAARSEAEREVTSHQLDAFHKTFNFCLSCRQYTCPNCWNGAEARCLSCAPLDLTDAVAESDSFRILRDAPVAEPVHDHGAVDREPDAWAATQPSWALTEPTAEVETEPISAAWDQPIADVDAAVASVETDVEPVAAIEAEVESPVSDRSGKAAAQTAGLLQRFRPGQSLDAELEAYERERREAAVDAAAAEQPVEAIEVEPVAVAEVERLEPAIPPAPDVVEQLPAPEPEPLAAASATDVVEQPTWQFETPATAPLQAGPTSDQPVAQSDWPSAPQWPRVPSAPALPFLGRPAAAEGGIEALWAASNQELVATPPTPGRSNTGIRPCVSCGLSLSATARFCRRCGTIQGG